MIIRWLVTAVALIGCCSWSHAQTSTLPTPQQPAETMDQLVETLKQSPVFVTRRMEPRVDRNALTQAAERLAPFQVKFIVVYSIPSTVGDASRLARLVRQNLNIQDGVVIVATATGVRASSTVLTGPQMTRAFQTVASRFSTTNYTDGLVAYAEEMHRTVADARARSKQTTTVFLAGVGLVVIFAVGASRKRRQREMTRLTRRAREVRARLMDAITAIDSELDVMMVGPYRDRAMDLRQSAALGLEQASALMEQAVKPSELWKALDLLETADDQLRKARMHVRDGGGHIEEPESADTPAQPGAPVIPDIRLDGCFFCSKPQSMQPMQPVTLSQPDGDRRVWACSDCAQQLSRGERPQMRVFRDGDRVTPWYDRPGYDPNRDYGRGGMDLVDMMILGSIFSGGWGGHHHHHYHTGDPSAAHTGDLQADATLNDAGGGELLGGLGGVFDTDSDGGLGAFSDDVGGGDLLGGFGGEFDAGGDAGDISDLGGGDF